MELSSALVETSDVSLENLGAWYHFHRRVSEYRSDVRIEDEKYPGLMRSSQGRRCLLVPPRKSCLGSDRNSGLGDKRLPSVFDVSFGEMESKGSTGFRSTVFLLGGAHTSLLFPSSDVYRNSRSPLSMVRQFRRYARRSRSADPTGRTYLHRY